MMQFLWVCLGGAVGTGARHLATHWFSARFASPLPYGTWFVNVGGSFLMGAIMCVGLDSTALSLTTRVALTTGFLGGLTTYSAFSYQTVAALREGALGLALTNLMVTTFACLLSCWAGIGVARWWLTR